MASRPVPRNPRLMTPRRDPSTLDVPGGRLAYDEAGHGPPVLLLHEGIADRRMWDPQFPRLAEHHRVVRYDLRGYGGSTPASQSFASFRDLKLLIDRLGIERPVLVGPSISGRTAMDFAVEYPGVAAGLFLISPGPPSGTEAKMVPEAAAALEADRHASEALLRAWTEGHREEAFELLRQLWCPALTGDARTLFHEMVRANEEEVYRDRSLQFDTPPDSPAVGRLGSLHLPVAIVLGDRDNPIQGHFANLAAQRIPGARVQIIAGGDHLLNLSRPVEFDATLARFLERVERAP